VTLTAAQPDRGRLEMKSGFGDIVSASPGGTAAAWISLMGTVQDQPGGAGVSGDPADVVRQAALRNHAVRPLTAEESAGPARTADGKPLVGLAVTDGKNKTSRIFLDPDTNLLRRVETTGPLGGAGTVILGGYKAVEGIQLPATMTVQQNGVELVALVFDRFELNPPVDDALFARPK
jgi:hypothetical protein